MSVRLEERSQVGVARRAAHRLVTEAGGGDAAAGRAALVATELATNVLRHAGRGEMLLDRLEGAARGATRLLALDRGPGIEDVRTALRDGHSTAGGLGTGLGAVFRNSEVHAVHSHRDSGCAVLAILSDRPGEPPPGTRRVFRFAGIRRPHPGERACGDGIAVATEGRRLSLCVIDALGHGGAAGEVAELCMAEFRDDPWRSPDSLAADLHQRIGRTRGAAAFLALVDAGAGEMCHFGVGNVGALLLGTDGDRGLVTHPGTLGYVLPRPRVHRESWTSDACLLVYTDGLSGRRWRALTRSGDLRFREPDLLAGVLYRDHARNDDDVGVLVVEGLPREFPSRNSARQHSTEWCVGSARRRNES